MADPAAFLSVRLPAATRDRLKAAAAASGLSVQALVGGLVEGFLARLPSRAPDLAQSLRRLRDAEAELRARGVTSVAVFGSVARGEAQPASDLDLLVDLAPTARVSAVGLASLRSMLTDLLGTRVDLVERGALPPTIRDAAEREAVRAW